MSSYPVMLMDFVIALLLGLNTAMLLRINVRGSARLGPLGERVDRLEDRMGTVETEVKTLASVPAQLREVRTLVSSALMAQQERQDQAEAIAIEESEARRALASALEAQGREFALLSRTLGRLACLDADPVIPCPSDKER
jgi:hypothetical protein